MKAANELQRTNKRGIVWYFLAFFTFLNGNSKEISTHE
jgi:hypothetical protein